MQIIPHHKLQNMINRGYKYNARDYSISNKFYRYINSIIAPYIPNYIAPNFITIIGFVFTIIAYISALYNSITMFFISVMCFMLLDSLDGAHARNINKSSPLGEILDHTLDSLSNTIIVMSFCILGNIPLINTFWLVQCMNIIFYLTHIKTYYNDMLKINNIGPTEAVIITTFLLILHKNYDIHILNMLSSHNVVLILYHLITFAFIFITIIPNTLQEVEYINNQFSKENNINNLLFITLPILLIPFYINDVNHFFIFTYSQIYHLLTLETIISKILQKNFNIITILLSIIFIMNIYLPIITSFLFLFYFGYIIFTLQKVIHSPLMFI